MKKIYVWITVFMLNISIAFAQTGLFNEVGATAFAVAGIVIAVCVIAFKETFNRLRKK